MTPTTQSGLEPAVTSAELRKLLKISTATFERWQAAGKFRRLEIHLGDGNHKRLYSRKLVMALLDGELVVRRSA